MVSSSFCFLQLIVLSRSPRPPPPRKYHTYCRSERDIANKHTARRRAVSSAPAPLGVINSVFAPNHRGPISAPLFQLHSSLRERSGRRQPLTPPAERSPVLSLGHTEYQQVLGEVPGGRCRYSLCVCVLVCLLSSLILTSISVLFANFCSQITPVLPIRT